MARLNPVRRSEKGQASVLLMVGAIIAVFLLASVFQVHRILTRSATGQDGADAAARAAATWQARGLNVIGNANVAQTLLLLEYLVPFGNFSENRAYLAESASHLARMQDEVAVLFPALGLVSATAVGREAGLAPLTATKLRQLNLESYAVALEELEKSSGLGRILAGGVYALPLRDRGTGDWLPLGVGRVAPGDLGGLLEEAIEDGLVEAILLLDELDTPLSVVPPHPVIFFGDYGLGSWWDTQDESIEEDVLDMLYTVPGGGGTEAIGVLTWRGRRKLELYLGYPPETVPIGEEGFPAVPAVGPIDIESAADRLGRSPAELLAAATRLAVELLREADEMPFSFYVYDAEFWSRTGASVTILGRSDGWPAGAISGGAVPAHFIARAAPRAGEQPTGPLVVPVYSEVRLLPVIEEVIGP